jgi:hypothetical protein
VVLCFGLETCDDVQTRFLVMLTLSSNPRGYHCPNLARAKVC